MKNFVLLKRVDSLLIVLLVIFSFNSCNKNTLGETQKTLIEEVDDTVTGIVGYPTIDCHIAKWYDNYPYTLNFTWDDALDVHEKIDTIFSKYDFVSTFFIQTSAFKKSTVLKMYKALYDRGNEIASHSVTHCVFTDVDLKVVEEELENSSLDLYKYFGYYPATFAHPNSAFNPDIDTLVGKYYLTSRYSSVINTDDRFFMLVRSYYDSLSFVHWIDNAMAREDKTWIVCGGHGVDGIGYEPVKSEYLDASLAYIKSNFNDKLWQTTLANSAMYKYLRENLHIEYGPDFIFLNRNHIKDKIQKYSNADCVISLIFPNSKDVVFESLGIVNERVDHDSRIVSINLRKSRIIKFKYTNE